MKLLRVASLIYGPCTSSGCSSVRQFCIQRSCLHAPLTGNPENVIQLNDKTKSERLQKTRKFEFAAIFLLIVPVTTFCLGVWQIQRYQLRKSLIEDLHIKHPAGDSKFPDNELKELEEKKARNGAYIATWFGISAATFYMWSTQFLRKRF